MVYRQLLFSMTMHCEFTKHPHFDLMLPSDELLQTCAGRSIKTRHVCHEWPLSCVERVLFEGGIANYCKSMRSPSMEIEVYASVSSPLLVSHQVIAREGPWSSILLDAFPGQKLSRETIDRAGTAAFADELRGKLSAISGGRPVFVDLSTVDKVHGHLTVTVERLHRRFGEGAVPEIDPSLLRVVEQCVSNQAILEAFIQDAVYSNGDLSVDNVLVQGNEMRVIDWQFPRIASLHVELVNLYQSLGIDPLANLSKAVVAAGLLCKIRWLAECADKWLTQCSYHVEITGLLTQLRGLGRVS